MPTILLTSEGLIGLRSMSYADALTLFFEQLRRDMTIHIIIDGPFRNIVLLINSYYIVLTAFHVSGGHV